MLGILGAAVLLVAIVVLDRLTQGMLRPPRRPPGRTPAALGLEFREWSVPGEPALEAWEMAGRNPDGPLLLLAHGWGANASVVLPLARAVVEEASRIVAWDVRGHGRSDEASVVSLRQFRDDALRVARAVAARWEEGGVSARPMIMAGHSMGGAAAILAADQGAPLAGIVLVATPCDVLATVARYLNEKGLPGHLLVPLSRPFFRLHIGLPERELSPARALPRLRLPVLVVQAGDDTRVPPSEGRRLAELAGTEMTLVPGAGHTDILEHPETAAALRSFLAEFGGR